MGSFNLMGRGEQPADPDSPPREASVALFGRLGVGKSALTVQMVQGIFVEKYDPTIQDTYRKLYGSCLLNFTDTVEELLPFRPVQAGKATQYSVFWFLYAMNDLESLRALPAYLEVAMSLEDHVPFHCILIGTKSDLTDQIQVTKEEVDSFMNLHHMAAHFQLSSKRPDSRIYTEILDLSVSLCSRVPEPLYGKSTKS